MLSKISDLFPVSADSSSCLPGLYCLLSLDCKMLRVYNGTRGARNWLRGVSSGMCCAESAAWAADRVEFYSKHIFLLLSLPHSLTHAAVRLGRCTAPPPRPSAGWLNLCADVELRSRGLLVRRVPVQATELQLRKYEPTGRAEASEYAPLSLAAYSPPF